MSPPSRSRSSAALTLWLALAACSDSDRAPSDAAVEDGAVDEAPSGEPAFSDNRSLSTDGDPCEAGTTTVVGLSQTTELGFAPRDLLEYAAGAHQAALHWSDEPAFELSPESGAQELAITLAPRSDDARVHVPEIDVIGGGAVCRPWIEIDVIVTLRSTQRALDERFEATLISEDARVAFLAATASEPELQGSLRVEHEGAPPEQLDAELTFSAFGVTGTLSGAWSSPASGRLVVAHWGHARCEAKELSVAPEQALEGVTPRALIDELQALDELAIAWQDGTTTRGTFRFESEGDGSACVFVNDYINGEGLSLEIDGAISLESADGRFRLEGVAAPLYKAFEGEPSGLHLSVTTNPLDTTGEELGFLQIDGSAFQPLHRELRLSVAPSGEVSGALTLNGVRKTNCIDSEQGPLCETLTERLEHGELSR